MSVDLTHWRWNEPYDQMNAKFERLKSVNHRVPNRNDKEHLIFVDVQQFQANDLQVSMSNGFVHVKGNHSERKDDLGWVERSFKRRIKIPDHIVPDSMEFRLSADGILTIKLENKRLKLRERTYYVPMLVQ